MFVFMFSPNTKITTAVQQMQRSAFFPTKMQCSIRGHKVIHIEIQTQSEKVPKTELCFKKVLKLGSSCALGTVFSL